MLKIKIVAVTFMFIALFFMTSFTAYSKTINDAETNLEDTLKYALINSLGETIERTIKKIYSNDEEAPEVLHWASYTTEILKIKQISGIGGSYEITLKVQPYYRAHITYGEDIIVLKSNGEFIDYKHVKTFPRVNFD